MNHLAAEYPDVDWQVLLDSITFLDNPSSEGYLPNLQKAQTRISAFLELIQNTPGVNVNQALDLLQYDLQMIFNEHPVYLPIVTR